MKPAPSWSAGKTQIPAARRDKVSRSPTPVGCGRHVKHPPTAFTERGMAMLSSVLYSRRAVEVNIAIMRAFVHLRELLLTHADLARRIDALEEKYDGRFASAAGGPSQDLLGIMVGVRSE